MSRQFSARAAACGLTFMLVLGGCGGAPRSAGDTAPAAAPSWAGRENVGRAIDLLNQGQERRARDILAKVLKRQPNDPIASGLIAQIDQDPVALLGRESFSYTVKPNETLADLAGRFLGNPTSFYALGRYNRLPFPVTLQAGQTLLIPGEPKVTRPKPPVEKPRVSRPAKAPVAPPPAPSTAPPARDVARATTLRAAALEQLNRGQIDRAVSLLQQAEQANPGNPLISRDLDRARRIQRTLRQ